MLYYQNKIYDNLEAVKSENFYLNNEVVNMVKEDYYNAYERYMLVRERYNNLFSKIEILNTDEVKEDKYKIYYSSNSIDPEKCYFIRDLKDIREESLDKILSMINEYKKGNETKLKTLVGKHGCFELKDD